VRSSRSALLALALAACGVNVAEPPPPGQGSALDCSKSVLTYQNFGAPFIANWCRGCHSSGLPSDMRQDAPPDSNFDTLDEVHTWSDGIVSLAGGDPASMPPAGGPSDDERTLLVEWMTCGAQ
jgi:uncharacterized membrane protein